MKDITILKDNFINIEDNTMVIHLQLSIAEFNAVYRSTNGKKKLSYVGLICSYNSDINIKGLVGEEAHIAACKKVGLPLDFTVDEQVKAAIKYYNKHYSHGVIGILKELHRSFELTRDSISMINSILYNYQRAIKNKLKGELTDEEAITLNSNISNIISNTSKVRDISGNLEDDINNLKKIEAKVVAVENKVTIPLGGGVIPKSALRTKN